VFRAGRPRARAAPPRAAAQAQRSATHLGRRGADNHLGTEESRSSHLCRGEEVMRMHALFSALVPVKTHGFYVGREPRACFWTRWGLEGT
jgi:hypothetical protein